jgi:predicted transposase/invertase (TIGR01784 family)
MKILFDLSAIPEDIRRQARENAKLGKSLNILQDIVFKNVFGADNDDSREALRSLLSSIIHREVSRVEVKNTELLPEYLTGKVVRLDIHVIFNDGEAADLEMQMSLSGDDLKNRAAFYAAKLLAGQPEQGEFYGRIKRVYQVFFLDSILFPEDSGFPQRFSLMNGKGTIRLSELIEVIFYELPKLEGLVNRYLRDLGDLEGLKDLSVEEKWCIFLKYKEEKAAAGLIGELCREEEGIMRAEQAISQVSRDYNEWAVALFKEKARRDYNSGLAYARHEGRAEGKVEGRNEGAEELAGLLRGGKTLDEAMAIIHRSGQEEAALN